MSQYVDVFNGDADGLCALVQLRRANPQQSQLVTGIKRDISLLKQVDAQAGAQITVLDISFKKNCEDVQRLLDKGCVVDYIDHHNAGELFEHPNLVIDIDFSADVCTSLIVDKRLQGRYRAWALTAAFGDNLADTAYALGRQSGFNNETLTMLEELGVLLNYNGYGASVDDLFFHPAELYKKLAVFDSPMAFMEDEKSVVDTLKEGYQQDMTEAKQISPICKTLFSSVIILPNSKWARRASGVFSNQLANQSPDKAHAVLIEQSSDSYLVSIRAPLNRKQGADVLASQFATGGGRKAAAGINALPKAELADFLKVFERYYSH